MPFVASPVHGLSLGNLTFVSAGAPVVYTEPSGTGETYWFNVLEADATWGNPKPVTETLLSLMTSGSQVVHVRDDNRDPALGVTIMATGPTALSAAEKVLFAEVGEPAELRWQPPSAAAALTVFDVVWSDLEHEFDSADELYLRRSYKINMQALPFARSATQTVTPAPSTTITTTTVDAASATTNWSIPNGPSGASLSVVSGAVRSTYNPALPLTGGSGTLYGTALRRTATIDTSVDKYVSIDWKTSLTSVYGAQTSATVSNLPEVRREPGAVAGFTRSWFQVPASVASLAWLQFGIVHPANTGSATLEIDLVQKQNALPISGTTRQKLMSVTPGGSARTQGTIHVTHATSALGRTIVFTHPTDDGYFPPLRPWRSASDTVTADANSVSGSTNPIAGVTSFLIPASSVPQGDVQLWARLGASVGSGPCVIQWSAESQVGSTVVGDFQAGGTEWNFASTGAWYFVPLARLTLPPAAIGPGGFVRIGLQKNGAFSSHTILVDEAWLFAMDRGRLSVVNCGIAAPSTGGSSNHLWLEAPSLTSPTGRTLVGSKTDGSDAYWPAASSPPMPIQVHDFDPDGTNIFVVTENALDATTDLTHYRRWHTNAGS